MDTAGKVVLRQDDLGNFRPTSEKRVVEAVDTVRDLILARKRLAISPSDKVAKATVTLVEGLLTSKEVTSEEMSAAMEIDGVSPALKKKARNWLKLKPIKEVLNRYVARVKNLQRGDREGRTAAFKQAAAEMYRCFREGIESVNPRDNLHSDYWRLVFQGAIEVEDVTVSEAALKRYQQAYGSNPAFLERLRRMQKNLGDLKEKLRGKPAPQGGESGESRGLR